MKGLIPYVIDGIRKQKPGHKSHSLSNSLERSYHFLLGFNSFNHSRIQNQKNKDTRFNHP
ncbi:hypothetical protein JHK85_003405 [Glycine max]|uniref:Uncharacterized protein n=2 Tax=Glycine subgen. Soja TaxID=1462606 RepID=K7K6J6_SOYBN|nr:hypothetical protein JHK87_003083 [Glycine soja]KAG5062222.1 hypothetical protein JHK85_003405 [Glycine max]KAG5079174.1 hypothetical protein JHK86_003239 [Glycine max]KAH1058825.1 hypothetical protein GYH30_003073 [Glycine max]RZC23502.1 hypothetical protein D0Y65_003028 [Glycine soja]